MAVRSSMELSETMYVWILASSLVLALVPGSLAGRLLVDENLETARKLPQISPSPSPVLATSPSPSSSSSPQSWVYVVGFGSVLLVVMALTALGIIFLRYKRKPTAVSPWKSGMSGHLQRPFETTVPFLKLSEVESACEDFSNIIGESSETIVYKGTLASGTEVAATRMKVPAANWNLQLELSFRRKVEALARMKHTHLVNLIAYCSEEEPNFVRMLVFEYASNGTVFDHLHKKESEHLDWLMRMRIVMGAAYGLEYMHHELVPAASHLGFDANSIFLTDDYSAKIANFGVMKMAVAKADTRQKGYWFGPRIVGYEDFNGDSDRFGPDFESNLFSFGVFLLEIVTGRPPHDEVTGHSLVEWASEYLADPKMVWYMVDPSLKSYNHDELVALCRIASLCLSPKNRRPTMRRVGFMLAEVLGITPELAAPKSSALLWAQLELEDEF
jgi:serine/threonine protein kinase